MSTTPGTIMIVDDEPRNLGVLDAMLRQAGYEVAAFPRGAPALAAAPDIRPDLILLDIRMPDMDGYEVCRRLKGDAALKDIPIMFLSALSETGDKLRAFEAGAVDYLCKPLSLQDVLARVRTHLALRRQSLLLEALVARRTRELDASNRRLRAIDEDRTHWLRMMSHELRTPLTGIFCIADSLFRKFSSDSDAQSMRADYDLSCIRIRKLLDDATTLATLDSPDDVPETETVNVTRALHDAIAEARGMARDVRFSLSLARAEDFRATASRPLMTRALADLLITAACCTPRGGTVTAETLADGEGAVIRMTTDGRSLPEEDLAMFFEIGGQRTLLKGGADFGLGPALAYRILKLFGATASVRNGSRAGIVIDVRLPLAPA